METSVFVVSDLHLGGAEGFQMCSHEGQQRLASFCEWVAAQVGQTRAIELVLAGDIVDFLSIEDKGGGAWSAFTADETEAVRKLDAIFASTDAVWQKLAACVQRGCTVTLMLGNHDVELSLPRVRRRFLQRLGPGTVDFIYDNQAYTRGQLLVEHGNRYEGWNVVDHDALRRLRSQVSRGVPVEDFPVQPGSLLVSRIMNKLKERYSWVDLIKPETSGVVPLLVALDAGLWRSFGRGIMEGARAAWRDRQFGRDGMPTDDRFISERTAPTAAAAEASKFPDEDIEQWLTANLADDTSQVGAVDALKEDVLFAAMRKWHEKDGRTFWVEREDQRYLNAAATLARRGYQVVVFGHTHHVKRVALADPSYATYFNTGTWADLIRIPPDTLDGEEAAARASFSRFFDDVRNNRVEALRRLIPTFARIDFDTRDGITSSDLFFFDAPEKTPRVDTAGVLARLTPA